MTAAMNTIPGEVVQLILADIDSIQELEVLLLLARSPSREWSARSVADELRTSDWSARLQLQKLETAGLATGRVEGEHRLVRYEPRSAERAAAVRLLAQLYPLLWLRIHELIYSVRETAVQPLQSSRKGRKPP
jgi:hypothetical protein